MACGADHAPSNVVLFQFLALGASQKPKNKIKIIKKPISIHGLLVADVETSLQERTVL